MYASYVDSFRLCMDNFTFCMDFTRPCLDILLSILDNSDSSLDYDPLSLDFSHTRVDNPPLSNLNAQLFTFKTICLSLTCILLYNEINLRMEVAYLILLPHAKSPELLTLESLLPRLSPRSPQFQELSDYYERTLSGYIGEISLDYYLRIASIHEVILLHGLRMTHENNTFQIDTLVMLPSFFLIIEVKNFRGEVIMDPHSLQMIRDDEVFPNPLLQADVQKLHLGNVLAAAGFPPIPIYTLAVFTHKKVLLRKAAAETDILVSQVLPQRIAQLQSDYRKKRYSRTDLLQVGRMLKKRHTPKQFRGPVERQHIQNGVRCPSCKESFMNWQRRTWRCTHCKATDRSAHLIALADYARIFQPEITNQDARTFLRLPTSASAYHLLKKSGYQKIGQNRGRKYIITL
ncbi:NERD domain-containing protein [Bacillus piscicola]|uniref:NERD domain-containing protein n=1 Tax=Bacillus piscicola TaxID=1632684 RepID=UPI001F095BFC|nr:NERD domain-containing protein [Bacillus piscicola]